MVAEAQHYVRVLVKVPEAYWLVRDYQCTRPGVLLLDSAGRKLEHNRGVIVTNGALHERLVAAMRQVDGEG